MEKILDSLMEEFNGWHETFIAGFDNHSGHCCSCEPYLYDDMIIIDNRYVGYADMETYEVWEKKRYKGHY